MAEMAFTSGEMSVSKTEVMRVNTDWMRGGGGGVGREGSMCWNTPGQNSIEKK